MARWLVLVGVAAAVGSASGTREPPVAVAPPPRPAATSPRPGVVVAPLYRGQVTNFWYVDVRINNTPTRLVVDTAASSSCISKPCAKRCGIDPGELNGQLPLVGGGTIRYGRVVYPSAAIGRISTSTTGFEIVASRDIDEAVTADDGIAAWDGLLGANFLHKYSAVIDYRAATLTLTEPLVAEADIQGRWACVGIESKGKALSKDGFGSVRLAIAGADVTFSAGESKLTCQLDLDPSRLPKRMDWRNVEWGPGSRPLIYKLDGDRLVLAGQLFAGGDGKPFRWDKPDFRSSPDGTITVATFEREP